jgi:hypothetical protein
MMYIANNPKGENYHFTMPWVKLMPNGDYTLKSDEWQNIPFNVEILKRVGAEAVYMNGNKFAT